MVQDPYDPQTLNRYSYCGNNPIIYTDPSGHFFWIAVAVGAALGGAMSAVTGGNIWMGMLMGAISGAAFFAAGEVIAVANAELAAAAGGGGATIHAFTGTMTGGINASISGGNGGMGMLTGGLSAGIGEAIGGQLPNKFAPQFAGRTLAGGVSGGIAAEIAGGDFGQGFAQGSGTAAAGFLCNHIAHKLVRLLENGGKKAIRYLSKAEAVEARKAGLNVESATRLQAKALEVAANEGDKTSIVRHKGHQLSDGSTGSSHYQTNGRVGHSFWGAALGFVGSLLDPFGAISGELARDEDYLR